MGGVSGSGSARTYPAKFAFGIAAKDCASDFVVFTTSTAGATAGGAHAIGFGRFSAAASGGGGYSHDHQWNEIPNADREQHRKYGTLLSARRIRQRQCGQPCCGDKQKWRYRWSDGNNPRWGGRASQCDYARDWRQFHHAYGSQREFHLFFGGTLFNGSGTPGQPTIFALNQLYADTIANSGCQTSTQAVPATFWSYNTGTGAVADLSPVLSFYDNGAQVAFMQRSGAVQASCCLNGAAARRVRLEHRRLRRA